MSVVCNLSNKQCKPCEGGTEPLSKKEIDKMLANVVGWNEKTGFIEKTFNFPDYYQVMAFVNATAYISHAEGHHPDIELFYDRCVIKYTTHAIGGLSENDFICAAKIDALMPQS